VRAMARGLRPGGRLFMAFPAEASTRMPTRKGTLNFWDDTTHVRPPDYGRIIELLQQEGVTVVFSSERYRPPLWVLIGLLNEPFSRLRGTVKRGTWALYGFESIVWGTRNHHPRSAPSHFELHRPK
jgi:hypothetical protein